MATQESKPSYNKRDLVVSLVIAAIFVTVFTIKSPGMALIVTFIPGVGLALAMFLVMWKRDTPLPPMPGIVSLVFVAMSLQFIHFAEEYVTGFPKAFPALYGGGPMNENFFVIFNMVMYALFTISALAVFVKGVRAFLMPILFYIAYGALGNAIAHTWWVIWLGKYFPGFYTSLLYWILGPWLIYELIGDKRTTLLLVLSFVLLLPVLLTLGMAV